MRRPNWKGAKGHDGASQLLVHARAVHALGRASEACHLLEHHCGQLGTGHNGEKREQYGRTNRGVVNADTSPPAHGTTDQTETRGWTKTTDTFDISEYEDSPPAHFLQRMQL